MLNNAGTIPIAGVTAYQLLYRTNGALPNTPLVTVTTVLKPANSLGLQLVGFATAEDSDNTLVQLTFSSIYYVLILNKVIAHPLTIIKPVLLQTKMLS